MNSLILLAALTAPTPGQCLNGSCPLAHQVASYAAAPARIAAGYVREGVARIAALPRVLAHRRAARAGCPTAAIVPTPTFPLPMPGAVPQAPQPTGPKTVVPTTPATRRHPIREWIVNVVAYRGR
jgi:hypothetical protein